MRAQRIHIPLAVLCVWSFAFSAFAQTPRVELFGGYSYLNAESQGRQHFSGAQAAVKFNIRSSVAALIDVGGQYRSDPSHTPPPDLSFFNFHDRFIHAYQFLAGPEFTRRGSRVDVFGHTLVGVLHGAARGRTENFLTFGLGSGVVVHGDGMLGFRTQADFLPNRGGGRWHHDLRIGAGLVLRLNL